MRFLRKSLVMPGGFDASAIILLNVSCRVDGG